MVVKKVIPAEVYRIGNQKIVTSGKFFKTGRIEEEWYEDVQDPESTINALKEAMRKPDIFTFWQRFPETEAKYPYRMEHQAIAVARIESYEHWYKKQIDSNARRAIKKAEKSDVVIKEVQFDDEFINGMVSVFNETRIRQGKPFWHYGKDFETVKRQFSRYLYREELIGAYHKNELIGFMFLANAGRYALPGQIISKIAHRDKATNNALISKAVEICERRKIPYFIYLNWGDGSLAEFKRRNGFEKVSLPRYYIPLTNWGKIVLGLHLHRGIVGILPRKTAVHLKDLRTKFYSTIYGKGG